ncbi:hypothetical protein BH11CYA1_BH11CYA1_21330 [soil metagenome]
MVEFPYVAGSSHFFAATLFGVIHSGGYLVL